jgi:hypothetical protein
MGKLKEAKCTLRVRQVDLLLAKEIMEPARAAYAKVWERRAGKSSV